MEDFELKYRIGGVTKFFMISLAVILDTIEVLLLLILGSGVVFNRFITIFEYIVYGLWFGANGVFFENLGKDISKTLGTFLGEMVPIVGSMPFFTIGVILLISDSRKEDEDSFEKKIEEFMGIESRKKQKIKLAKAKVDNPNITRVAKRG